MNRMAAWAANVAAKRHVSAGKSTMLSRSRAVARKRSGAAEGALGSLKMSAQSNPMNSPCARKMKLRGLRATGVASIAMSRSAQAALRIRRGPSLSVMAWCIPSRSSRAKGRNVGNCRSQNGLDSRVRIVDGFSARAMRAIKMLR